MIIRNLFIYIHLVYNIILCVFLLSYWYDTMARIPRRDDDHDHQIVIRVICIKWIRYMHIKSKRDGHTTWLLIKSSKINMYINQRKRTIKLIYFSWYFFCFICISCVLCYFLVCKRVKQAEKQNKTTKWIKGYYCYGFSTWLHFLPFFSRSRHKNKLPTKRKGTRFKYKLSQTDSTNSNKMAYSRVT